jgi:hypothetical protein
VTNNNRCPKCKKGTTKKLLDLKGMCGGCAKIYERASFRETLAAIPQEVEATVAEAILERATLALAASAMKKAHPLKHPLREWDPALVILVDERRRGRTHG